MASVQQFNSPWDEMTSPESTTATSPYASSSEVNTFNDSLCPITSKDLFHGAINDQYHDDPGDHDMDSLFDEMDIGSTATRENIFDSFRLFDQIISKRSWKRSSTARPNVLIDYTSSKDVLSESPDPPHIYEETVQNNIAPSTTAVFLVEDEKESDFEEKTSLEKVNQQRQDKKIIKQISFAQSEKDDVLPTPQLRVPKSYDNSRATSNRYSGPAHSDYPKWIGFTLPDNIADSLFSGYIETPDGQKLTMTEDLKKNIHQFLMVAHVLEFYLHRFSFHIKQVLAYTDMNRWVRIDVCTQFNRRMMDIRRRTFETQTRIDKQLTKEKKLDMAKNFRINCLYEQERHFCKLELVKPKQMTQEKLFTLMYQVMLNYHAFLLELKTLTDYYKTTSLFMSCFPYTKKGRKKKFLVHLGEKFVASVNLYQFGVVDNDFHQLLVDVEAARTVLRHEIIYNITKN